MAYTTGTAANALDLMSKLRDYLISPDCSSSWEIKRWDPTNGELIAMGKGLGGTDQIFVGMKYFYDVSADFYNWKLNGYIGYDPAQTWNALPGALLNVYPPQLPLWNGPIPYWFVVNGRRIIVVARIGTRYEAAYLGFILPYSTPGQYPYPIAIGGSLPGSGDDAYTYNYRYSSDAGFHSHFVAPGSTEYLSDANTKATNSTLIVRLPAGTWAAFACFDTSETNNERTPKTSYYCVWPYNFNVCTTMPNVGGGYTLLPIVLTDNAPNVYGEFDGCFWLTGYDNAPENLVTVNGVDHLVIPNVFRTKFSDWWALKLQ